MGRDDRGPSSSLWHMFDDQTPWLETGTDLNMMWIPPDLASLEDANTKKKQKEAHTSVAVGDPRPRGGFIPWDKDKGTQSGEIAAFLKLKKALQGSVMSKYPGSSETCVKKGHDILARKNVKSQVMRRDKKTENLYFGKSGTMQSYKKEVEAGLHGNRPKEDNTMSWAISRQFQLAAAKNGTSYPMPYKGDLDVTEEEPEEEDSDEAFKVKERAQKEKER